MKARFLLLGLVGALASAAPAWAAARDPRIPTRQQLKACPAFADVDFKGIYRDQDARPEAPVNDWRGRLDERHAKTRGPYGAFEAPADAAIALRIWAGGSETQEYRTDTSSIVWLGADGVWRVNRVDHSTNRPLPPKPPPPPDEKGVSPPYVGWTQEEVERMQRTAMAGVLEPERAAGIEMALADPCFQLQPDAMPLQVPVRKGKPPRGPCYGVIGGTLEIRWADRRWRDVTELCGGFYASGIISAVMYARPYFEDEETRAQCDPLRAIARASLTPPQLRDLAFCEAGLMPEVRRNRLGEAERDALHAEAARLAPAAMPERYKYLSEWSAAALAKAIRRLNPSLPKTEPAFSR
ncbi:MAG TPA: hypothetical protein VGB59_01295 [Allosphingosinicella sp.]|jgi:hypothetical protein